MQAAVSEMVGRWAAAFRLTLPAPRLIAILPMALLCGFWALGEPLLIVSAIAVPVVAAISGRGA